MTASEWLRRAWQFERPQVLSAQMLPLHRSLLYASSISVLIAWLAAGALHTITQSRWTWPWAIGATLVLLASLLWQQRLPHPADLTRVHRYARGLRGIALMTGMCWGVMGVLFIDVDQPYAITIVLVMVAGMSSGAVAVYASCWPLALLYCAANIIPVGLTLLMSGQAAAMMLGVAGLLYFYAMAVFAYHVAQSVTRAIELGFENEGLVERLRDQTQRALEARELAEGALADAEKANR